jgi:hypothetical protein
MKTKPLIAAILTMIAIYLLISFAVWELNAKYWEVGVRVMYSLFAPIFAALMYSSVKLYQEQNYK